MAPTLGQMLAAIGSPAEWGAVATTKLVWDDTNKRLGIGVQSPGHSLDVETNIRIGGTHIITSAANFVFDKYNNTGSFLWRKNATAGDISSYTTLMGLSNDGVLNVQNIPTHETNAAAKTAGLVAGDFYQQTYAPGWLCVVY